MRNSFSFITGLLAVAASTGLAPVARAQTISLTLMQYHDSARTRPRVRYQVQLRSTRPDTVPHGAFRRYWRDGSLAEHGRFTDGQPDSIWTRYYPAAPGQPPAVARRLPMRAGQPEGPFVVYHPDGRVAQRGTFRQGQLVDSLVTTDTNGKPRLLAHFAGGPPGLSGQFRQYHSRFTAQPLAAMSGWPAGSDDNPYLRYDAARYWTGQLATGKMVGRFTENDADGQPRIRLLFDSVGHLQMITSYYPARWLRHELLAEGDSARASRTGSMPALQVRAVGPLPYLLQRAWDWDMDSTLGDSQLSRAVGEPRHPVAVHCGQSVGASMPGAASDTLMSVVSRIASFWAVVPRRPVAADAPDLPFSLRVGQVPVPYKRQYWRLVETDTLTGTSHRVRRRELRYPDGRLAAIETPHGYKYFDKLGKLTRKRHITRRGVIITRSYYGGRLHRASWHRPDGVSFFRRRRGNGWMPLFRQRVVRHGFR